jgi:hypothetical protein
MQVIESHRLRAPARFSFLQTALLPMAAFAVLAGFAEQALAAGIDCRDTQAALEYWRPIREQAPTAESQADALALELTGCLGSPNPELRDRIAYELFATWLRGGALSDDTRRALFIELESVLAGPLAGVPDHSVLKRSFSALVLAEIMRADSLQPFLSDAERQGLLKQAIDSIERENDYRGLDAELGWVHPVAHMSDLLWRFVLHPATSAAEDEAILAAVRSKVAPTAVFYSFNESDRLARVVTTMILRERIAPDIVVTWLGSFAAPSSMQKWSDAFASPEGMAELHNTKLFLRALADQLDGEDIDARIRTSLAELVQGFTQLI